VQIGPQGHDYRQQKNPPRSFQTFSVEYYGEQHRRNVRRSGEIDIRVCRGKSGIKQARGQNGNADRNRGSAAAQAEGREISGYYCATRNYKYYETGKTRMLK
jgi:hypothetical protein